MVQFTKSMAKNPPTATPHGRDARATMWVSRATLCLPKTPAPEGRHSACRGSEAPGFVGEELPPIPTEGCATGNGNVGPTELKSAGGTTWFNSRRAWKKSPMPTLHGRDARATMWVSRATLCLPTSPAPEGRHNVCRGREAPGARRRRTPSYPNRRLRHRQWKCRPSGPEERWRNTMVQFTKSMEKISNADSTRAGRPCHVVGLVNSSLFTQNTSPGGAA
jgi:hypothetical protein